MAWVAERKLKDGKVRFLAQFRDPSPPAGFASTTIAWPGHAEASVSAVVVTPGEPLSPQIATSIIHHPRRVPGPVPPGQRPRTP